MIRKFINRFGILLVIAVLFLGVANLASRSSGESDKLSETVPAENPKKYPKAPEFTLKDLNGNDVSLSDFSGKLVFVNFWATWCGPCRQEIPGFIKMYDKYHDKGLVILGISTDRDGSKKVQQFADKNKMNYPVLMFNMKIINDYGGITGIPTTFIVNRQGEIVNKFVGFPGDQTFEEEIKKWLLKETS